MVVPDGFGNAAGVRCPQSRSLYPVVLTDNVRDNVNVLLFHLTRLAKFDLYVCFYSLYQTLST